MKSLLCFLLGSIMLLPGCRDERFFGPYSLEVPTSIRELAAGRTFQFPLDDADLEEIDDLAACQAAEAEEPTRETPCVCDFPVLRVDEQHLRVDYRLTHIREQAANVLVWVGYQVAEDQPPPDILPDLPRIEVLGEHHHHVPAGARVDGSFLEDELDEADRTWAVLQHPDCEQETEALPSAQEILFGLALESEEPTGVSVEFTFRIRQGDQP